MIKSSTNHQLKQAGATPEELRELSDIARQLGALEIPHLGAERAQRIAERAGFGYQPRRTFVWAPWLAVAAASMALVVVLAQYAAPGTPLYTIRENTRGVGNLINPEPSASPDASASPNAPGKSPGKSSGAGASSPSTTKSPDDKRTGATATPKTSDDPKKTGSSQSPSPTPTSGDDHGGKVKGAALITPSPTPKPTSTPSSNSGKGPGGN